MRNLARNTHLIRDHNGDSTVYVYDGNGNLVSKTDADGYVTRYSYTALDLVKKINYNGAKGGVRPDYYKVGHSVDIKNYNLESNSGRRNLVRNIVKQYEQRLMHLPEGSKQSVQIDLRGQNVSDEVLTKLYTEITQKNKWRSKHFLQSEISGVVNYTGLLKKYSPM